MYKAFSMLFALVIVFVLVGCGRNMKIEVTTESDYDYKKIDSVIENPNKIALFKEEFKKRKLQIVIPPNSKIDTLIIDENAKTLSLNLSKDFSYIAFRKDNVDNYYSFLKNYFGEDYKDYSIEIKSMGIEIKDLIPNFYRSTNEIDSNRILDYSFKRSTPIIENIDRPFKISKGLYNRNIALWHSHGWYYSVDAKRWEWQRPRLFQTVEDLIPLSFVIPYIAPMLENAGATVFIPRERDYQINEIVIDNDSKLDVKNKLYNEKSSDKSNKWRNGNNPGFAVGNPPYEVNFNPFTSGTSRYVLSDTIGKASVKWFANIKESGDYAVYLSYLASDNNVCDALYKIKHAGGITSFSVNQKIGGNTWLYVGKFKFNSGEDNYVELVNKSKDTGLIVSADAVRFGGGMGNVKREGSTSGRPKFVEGAKYYLQYAGMPDTLIYNLSNNKHDYNDDYRSRTEYTNYLIGAPFGPLKNRNEKGLGIPIDLSMSFHTDAGITNNDTTIGTLAIYSLLGAKDETTFPDGTSRLACRDLTDIIQTEIVNDIRNSFDLAWNKRHLREAQYAESQRPNVPAILLELLSHQNFLDMKFMLDPQFRFTVSRAIYKGMLKFLSVQNNFEYVVQPLPVTNFQIEFVNENSVELNWKETIDKTEPTAKATGYMVYTRIDNGGFDNGVFSKDNKITFSNLIKNKIYSYKITAINDGGESFPSEILSACKSESEKPVLVVNAFDRVSAPGWVNGESFSGFMGMLDFGVPDKVDLGFVGYQHDFDPKSQFISNDEPGHGASSADDETKVVAGNTFDFAYIHGLALKNNGFSFVSCSDETVEEGTVDLNKYQFVDFIFGEEKETPYPKKHENETKGVKFRAFTKPLQNKISDYLTGGGNVFVSGAYIGTDLFRVPTHDSVDINFGKNILKYQIATGQASKSGKVDVSESFKSGLSTIIYSSTLNDKIYPVEAPDAINAINGSETIMRYNDNQFSAGIGYKDKHGIIAVGFPFETIISEKERNDFMRSVLQYLQIQK